MSKVILVTGGARSGKSGYALRLANVISSKMGGKAFIATAVATDDEMKERILRHQKEREKDFFTYEEPGRLSPIFDEIVSRYDFILVDCLTFFINNLLLEGLADDDIYHECDLIIGKLDGYDGATVFVTNEVGMGIVPDNELARRFRDLQGRVNQKFAEKCDELYLLVSGQALKIK